ncbi:MAG: DUF167 domain-containing protein [Patescibacteria group bacterium]
MYIHVKIIAKAKKESIKQENEDHFLISVREPAERNLANTRVIEILALHFKLPVAKVKIINGHKSPSKLISIKE